MNVVTTRNLVGILGFGALLVAMAAVPLAGCDSDECEENAFQCEGPILSRCKSGAFEFVEDCTGKGECLVIHGHCHDDGAGGGHEGGHHAGGGHEGGHSEGGHHEGGHHEGGHAEGGHHEGGGGGAGGG